MEYALMHYYTTDAYKLHVKFTTLIDFVFGFGL